ncbi:iron transporter [Rubrobacter xylanophilus]|uniref:Iron transporter n=1 Tax=Rubrobacter xylanophilus TaxID=49319 RepID=A0A510HLR8_9ACTN|nr:IucA/IucC family protein [Rubrobacter xylanophilus]BBL80950.1 iron transporter [Rubrobacter xylanophilus]
MLDQRMTARQIADRATMQNLLNCFLRETGRGTVIPYGTAGERAFLISLDKLGMEVLAPLRYLSPTGRHLFGFPVTAGPEGDARRAELDPAALAALISRELFLERGGSPEELLLRSLQSRRNVERFVEARLGERPEKGFIAAEQSLVFGHPLHPTPKSRQGFTGEQLAAYSPEMGASFPLHYFRAHRSIVAEGSALPRRASQLILEELRRDPGTGQELPGDEDHALVPAHPWQAEMLLRRPEVRRLVEEGLLEHLGPLGSPYRPTSSVRTVYRAEARFMLKLSLGVGITNSVRNNLRGELLRGMKMCRVLESAVGRELRERFPDFRIIRDPAHITVETGGGKESGFEVLLRENPFHGGEDAAALVALCQDGLGEEGSRLARIVRHLAREEGRPPSEVSREWFRRYLEVSLRPILWLYFAHGIAPEAHQQNSVLELEGGYPARFYYRDNQGYYFRESAREHLERLVPGVHDIEGGTVVEDALADERLRYYFFVNNLFGVVNALGCAGLADERELLRELRRVLEELEPEAPPASELVPSLLHLRRLPCKANLLTRLHDMDELLGDLETQSVYVEVDNPLAEVSA